MPSYESIIGQALFSGDHETGLAKTAVKFAVQRAMFCACGKVLDQSTAVYLETPKERPCGVLCPDCWEDAKQQLPTDLAYLKYTWEGLERVNC